MPIVLVARGEITMTTHEAPESDQAPGPEVTVRAYLIAMEARDLDAARSLLGTGFSMTFPGNVRMTELSDLVAWAAPRYRFVKKTYEGFETVQGDRSAVVYCRGKLSGAWPDGQPFDGIRFIDRFEIVDGLIVRQDVWNDIAETRATA